MLAPIYFIRKHAALERGRQAFECYGADDETGFVEELRLRKMAHADPELLSAALWCTDGDALDLYEVLGGEFTKEAISGQLSQSASSSSKGPPMLRRAA